MSSAAAARRILVTGAGGFVGANLVRRLAADGHEVTAAARAPDGGWRLAGLAPEVRLVQLDVRDRDEVHRLIGGLRPEVAFHLAAHGAYHWQRDATRIFATNVLGTVNVVEACRDAGCRRLVNAGSSSEYGAKDHPAREDEPLEPGSDYGAAKAAATLYCAQAAKDAAMELVTLRLYSAYGPFEDPARLMPTLVVHALRGELPPLVDPDTARDFVALDDVLEAFVLAGTRELPATGRVYNVGSGRQRSIRDVVAAARRVFGVKAEARYGSAERRPWDTTIWVAAAERIRAELGWRPRLELDGGLERMAAWIESEPGLWERYGLAAPTSRGALSL